MDDEINQIDTKDKIEIEARKCKEN